MDNVSCEKRFKNGQYCKRTRQYSVKGGGILKYVCETHLESVIKFIATPVHNKTCEVRVLLY